MEQDLSAVSTLPSTSACSAYSSHRLSDGIIQYRSVVRAHAESHNYIQRCSPVSLYIGPKKNLNSPQPHTRADRVIDMIVTGTAMLAFVASSLICTGASKHPKLHRGARKLKMKAKPSGHPDTVETTISYLVWERD